MALDAPHASVFRDNYETLLAGYAFGTLDIAQSLIVAAHLTFSPEARRFVRACETIGGGMMEADCSPVSMSGHALEHVLGCLDRSAEPPAEPSCANRDFGCPEDLNLPSVVLAHMDGFRWKTVYPGFQACKLELACKESKARLLKFDPATQVPHHRHNGLELTLVLDGAYEDENGRYDPGALAIQDQSTDHTPKACAKHGCVCMMVLSEPVSFYGWKKIFNPFLRMGF